ncbi:MAG TPA: DNA polymerase ligase N-terminal domain-containing protein [Gemmatimonadaceae bacterium]|nr:DNA polymerase ligase N-terminal domain-containing protein [Gemmatimonadaceae bacterium]
MAARKRPTGSLIEYKRKRDFTKTEEPAGQVKSGSKHRLRFVIQKHAASHLHFDFRLELDGVMKSWAVPKGPSYDPTTRRLAMQVEDHPIEYNTFEGTIPKGQYGGGTVMLWDRGTYEPESGGGEDALREGYERGDLKFVMHGKRMQGGWVLVRMRRDESGKAQWLLIKHRDDYADPKYDVVEDVVTSVATGRTMEQITHGRSRVWNSNRDSDDDQDSRPARRKPAGKTAAKKKSAAKKKVTAKKTAVRRTSGRKSAGKQAPARKRSRTVRAR